MTDFRFRPVARLKHTALLAALALAGCAPGLDEPTPTATIDVSRYVAVGDSYTAGFSAGGLTRTSQEYAYPNLLMQQFRRLSADAPFGQPLLEPGTGAGYLQFIGFERNGTPRGRWVAGQSVQPGRLVINPAACGGADTIRLLARSATASTLPQNLGVPGLRLSQLETANLGNQANATPGTAFNPYFERLLPANDSRTYLQVVTAAASNATFFTFFPGIDEVMPYVRSGGNCGNVGSSIFRSQLRANTKKLLDVLSNNGKRPGIIAQVPLLTTLPLLSLGRGDTLQLQLQIAYGDTARLYIAKPVGTGGQAITKGDYVLATAISRIGIPTMVNGQLLPYGRHIRNPLRDEDVLDNQGEVSSANGAINAINNELIRLVQNDYKLPTTHIIDLYTDVFNTISSRIAIDGVVYSAEPVRGNIFSLDYYSLTPRGNAVVANAFIKAINEVYKANLPAVDVNSVPTGVR